MKKQKDIKIWGTLMFGDVDGYQKLEDFISSEDLPILKDWFYAYSKKFPKDIEDEYFWVNYAGSYEYPARINWSIVKDLADFTKDMSKKLNWDAEINIAHISEYINPFLKTYGEELSHINTAKDFYDWIEDFSDEFINTLLAYAYYWDFNDRNDKYLIKYQEIEGM